MHSPVYGDSGVFRSFSLKIEEFLDENPNYVKAVVSGHIHRFSLWERKGVVFLTTPSLGGIVKKEVEIDGVIDGDDGVYGGEHHIKTIFGEYGGVTMEIEEETLKYTLIGVNGTEIW